MHHSVWILCGMVFVLFVGAAGICHATEKQVSTTVEAQILASRESVFDFTVAEDVLPKVLWDHGIIPGVSSTQVLKIPSWDQAGALRIVYLNDGNTTHEEITSFERPGYFAYRVFQFSGSAGHLVSEARGQWWFEEKDGYTHVKWTYTFIPKGKIRGLTLRALFVPSFHGYMEDALSRIKSFVESENAGH